MASRVQTCFGSPTLLKSSSAITADIFKRPAKLVALPSLSTFRMMMVWKLLAMFVVGDRVRVRAKVKVSVRVKARMRVKIWVSKG